MAELSGVEAIASEDEAARSRLILDDIRSALDQVATPEAREVLLDMTAMHLAALDGWEVRARAGQRDG